MLTSTRVSTARPKAKEYNLTCGKVPGLHLRVRPAGSKSWLFNYTRPFTGKRTNIGLGQYPTTTLAQARQTAELCRVQLAQKIDPKADREASAQEQSRRHLATFESVARAWLKTKDVSDSYAFKIRQGLENHVFQQIGGTPVHLITAQNALIALKPLEDKDALVTLGKVTRWINEVMNYALNIGLVNTNPLSGIRAAFKKPRPQSMPSINPQEIPRLMQAIAAASITNTIKCLVLWQIHTMTRPGEAAGARWREIDFIEKIWTIPAERMKKSREHIVPLTPQSLAILVELQNNYEFVFPGATAPHHHANSQSVNMALKRMGFKGQLVSHGLRHLASTTLNEQRFDHDVIEAALSHVDSNSIRAAYNKANYLAPRREMMEWWSTHLEGGVK